MDPEEYSDFLLKIKLKGRKNVLSGINYWENGQPMLPKSLTNIRLSP
jgi:hypothetical protein